MNRKNHSGSFSIDRSLANGFQKAIVKQKSYVKNLPLVMAGLLVASTFLYISVPFVEASVASLSPTSVGPSDANQWSVTPGSDDTAKVAAVQIDDGDDSYIYETVNNERQTFGFPGASLPAGSTINSVTLYGIAKGFGAGSSPKKMVLTVRSSDGTFSNSTDIVTNAGYTTHEREMTVNPFTSNPWTLAEVNGWTTTFGVARSNDNGTVRVTQIYLEVDYTLGQENTAEFCSDQIDNDGDQLIDLDDPDCAAFIPQPGTLTVVKQVINDNGGGATADQFTLTVAGGNASPSSFPGDESGTAVTIDPDGSYSVGETGGPSGYGVSFSGDCSGAMPAGGQKTCTVTNDDIQPALTVVKVVDGGSKVIADFPLFVDQTSVTSGESNGFNAGSHTVSETGDPDYTLSFTGACNTDGVVTLSPGDDVICTLTNSYQTPPPASLTVIKHVINDDTGDNIDSDFTMLVEGANVSSSSFPGSENGTTVTLDAGTYNVTETGPEGYHDTYSEGCSGALEPGQQATCTVTNDDMPSQFSGSISGYKFNDANNNGSFDTGDSYLEGWRIFLDLDQDGVWDEGVEDSDVTDSNGFYSFVELAEGTHLVWEVGQTGWTQTMPLELDYYSISLSTGTPSSTDNNFGNYQNPIEQCTGSIDGKVFNDENINGVLDAGEAGLADWTLYLDKDDNNELSAGDTEVTTDANGVYHFGGLPSGTYILREVVQSGWYLVYPDPATDGGEYSVSVTCDELSVSSFDLMIQAITSDGADVNFANGIVNPPSGGGGGGSYYTPPTPPSSNEEVRGEQETGSTPNNEAVGGEQSLPVTGTTPWAIWLMALMLIGNSAYWLLKPTNSIGK
ncbi:MAG: SdrD B-like domain-containing protein [bacterium]